MQFPNIKDHECMLKTIQTCENRNNKIIVFVYVIVELNCFFLLKAVIRKKLNRCTIYNIQNG